MLSARLHSVEHWQDLSALLPALDAAEAPDGDALGSALLRAACKGGELHLHSGVLQAISACQARQGWVLHHTGWQALAEQARPSAETGLRRRDLGFVVTVAAAFALSVGAGRSMAWLLPLALRHLPTECLPELHARLWRAGLLGQPADLGPIAAGLLPCRAVTDPAMGHRALMLLGLFDRRPMPWAGAVVEHVALPWLLDYAERDAADAALHIEAILVEHWLKREESEAHYARWIARWAPALHAMGRRQAAVLPPPAAPRRAGGMAGRPKLAAFIHNGVLLAHTETLLMGLQALRRQADAGFDVLVCVLGHCQPEFRQAFEAAGASVLPLQERFPGQSRSALLRSLRGLLAAEGCAGLLWLCHPHLLSYAMGLGLAPRTAWWSMKFHPPAIEGVDMRLTFIGGASALTPVTILGREWLAMPAGLVEAVPPAAAARPRAGSAVVLTTIMREDKLDSPAFWDTAIAILQQAPQAVWRYAGRQDLPALRARLVAAGVAERAVFAGWVDPVAECRAADIYLDGWPFTSGMTAMQGMLCGLPYVFRNTPMDPSGDGAHGTPLSVLDQLWRMPKWRGSLPEAREAAWLQCFAGADGSLLRWPESAAEQVAWALDLITDAELRRRTGAAFRRFATLAGATPADMADALAQVGQRLLAGAPMPQAV